MWVGWGWGGRRSVAWRGMWWDVVGIVGGIVHMYCTCTLDEWLNAKAWGGGGQVWAEENEGPLSGTKKKKRRPTLFLRCRYCM